MQRFQALSTMNQALLNKITDSSEINHSRSQSMDIIDGEAVLTSFPNNSDIGSTISHASSCRSLATDNQSWVSDPVSSAPEAPTDSSSESQVDFLIALYLV